MRQSLGVLLICMSSLPGCTEPKQRTVAHLPDPVFRPRPKPAPRRPTPPPQTKVPPPAATAPTPSSDVVGLPGNIAPLRLARNWRYIVIHHSATETGNAQRFDGFHRKVRGWDELGYHFVIGNGSESADGLIEVGPRWWKQKHGAHCKTPDNRYNDYGIGICLVGNFQKVPPSRAQMTALERLLAHLMHAYGIPPSHVYGHGGITHRTACPGAQFPLRTLKSRLASSHMRRF